jgi:hypothetical protein
MKEVQVIVRCDNCGGQGAETYTEANSRGKLVEIDLDKACRAIHEDLKRQYEEAVARAALILSPILELADQSGVTPDKVVKPPKVQKPSAAKRVEAPRICLLCPETRDTDWTLRGHLQRDHGLSGSLSEVYGTVCPVDAMVYPKLGLHVQQAHATLDLPHYSHVFLWAQQNGDPHGVYAKQVAEVQRLADAAKLKQSA